jgi:phage/plasmid-like protein (TIGR03299 family)
MAHNLATTNGKTAMMYTGETPWHQLGTKLNQLATAAEAIEASGLNYRVELKSLATEDGTAVPQRKGVVRSDTKAVLGVVGNSYIPVQNYQAFDFLDEIVAGGGLRYHTAGALGKGERIWMLAKLPTEIRVKESEDVVDKFLLLSNTHDGSTAMRVYFTPIRVVCQNTLNLAEQREHGQGIAIMHRGNLRAKIQRARQVLGLAKHFYDDAEAKINILARHTPTPAQLKNYFEDLYPDPEHSDNSRAKKVRESLNQIFETGIGLDIRGIEGTTWAAYNAVTEYVDYHLPTRSPNPLERALRRLNSSWFGSGAKVKARAWNLALQMAQGQRTPSA